jgi:hypothetical protein
MSEQIIDDDPEGLNDPWANKVWEIVLNLRAALARHAKQVRQLGHIDCNAPCFILCQ